MNINWDKETLRINGLWLWARATVEAENPNLTERQWDAIAARRVKEHLAKEQ